MKDFIKTVKEDRIIFAGFTGIILFFLINLGIIIFSYSELPPFIPLYNQLPWGEKRLGFKNEIIFLLIIPMIVSITNSTILAFYYKKTPLIARMLTLTSFLISFLSLLLSIRTIQNVI